MPADCARSRTSAETSKRLGLDNRSKLDATDVSATASAIDVPVSNFVVSTALGHLNDDVTAETGTLTPSNRHGTTSSVCDDVRVGFARGLASTACPPA